MKDETKDTLFIYDRSLRELLKGLPEKFIEILTGKRGIRFIDTSLPQVKERRPDLIVELEDGSVFHLEVQTKKDPNIDFRMIDYYIALKQLKALSNKKIVQMVLYLEEKEKIKETEGPIKEVSIDDGKLKFSYEIRYINDIECRPLIESEDIEDNILATLCRIDDFSYFWNRLKEKLLKFPLKQRRDYLMKLTYLMRLRPNMFNKFEEKIKEEVEYMPLVIDKEKDPLYIIGEREGIREGIKEGMREGIKEGIKGMLEIRFGGEGVIFYKRYVENIDSIDKLEELKEKIKRVKNIEELL